MSLLCPAANHLWYIQPAYVANVEVVYDLLSITPVYCDLVSQANTHTLHLQTPHLFTAI